MHTPLQMLIKSLDREALDKTGFYDAGELEVISKIKAHATELLENERSTIERAYSVGLCQNCFNGVTAVSNKMASDYFTKTFTEKKD